MIAFLKNFFQKYFYDDEHYAAVFFLFIGLIILYFFGGILAPILISILIAYLLNGLMTFLENKGNSKILSLSMTLIFFSIFYFSIFLLFPFLSRQILLLVSDIPQIFETVNLFLSSQLKEYSDIFSENPIMNAILYLIIIPFLVFFLLKDKDYFLENLKLFLPNKRELLSKIWTDLNLQLYGYLKGKGLEMLIVALVTAMVFSFQGVNYSIILALLIGLSVLIPYVGAILVTIPVIIIGLFQWGLDSSFYNKLFDYTSLRWKCFNAFAFRQRSKITPSRNYYGSFNFWRNMGILGIDFGNTYCNFFKSNSCSLAYKGCLVYQSIEFNTSST